MKNILLGVTGSIAAYKSADITSGLVKLGYDVHVVMTKAATQFITPLTLQTLSRNTVRVDLFQTDTPSEVKHVTGAENADIFLVAPATANIIGKMANGIADDMLSSLFLVMRDIPMYVAPAMNTRMYENPIVEENTAKLVSRGVQIIEPRVSRLACGYVGKGAMATVDDIINIIDAR